MRVSVAALAAAVFAITAACTVDGNAPPTIAGTSSGVCVGGLQISPMSATRHPGDTLQVQAVGSCSATFDPTQIRWASSDTLVAQVDSLTGLVLARSRGVVTVIGAEVADRTVKGAMVLSVVP
jgi:uncharacterized protein YjdB